jgi:hypothetical protein
VILRVVDVPAVDVGSEVAAEDDRQRARPVVEDGLGAQVVRGLDVAVAATPAVLGDPATGRAALDQPRPVPDREDVPRHFDVELSAGVDGLADGEPLGRVGGLDGSIEWPDRRELRDIDRRDAPELPDEGVLDAHRSARLELVVGIPVGERQARRLVGEDAAQDLGLAVAAVDHLRLDLLEPDLDVDAAIAGCEFRKGPVAARFGRDVEGDVGGFDARALAQVELRVVVPLPDPGVVDPNGVAGGHVELIPGGVGDPSGLVGECSLADDVVLALVPDRAGAVREDDSRHGDGAVVDAHVGDVLRRRTTATALAAVAVLPAQALLGLVHGHAVGDEVLQIRLDLRVVDAEVGGELLGMVVDVHGSGFALPLQKRWREPATVPFGPVSSSGIEGAVAAARRSARSGR